MGMKVKYNIFFLLVLTKFEINVIDMIESHFAY